LDSLQCDSQKAGMSDQTLVADREWFWQQIMTGFDGRLRGYLLRARIQQDDVDEVLWDVWQLAVEQEKAICAAIDPWDVIKPLVRLVCRELVRRHRHETPSDPNRFDETPSQPEAPSIDYDAALRSWLDDALKCLTVKQRLAVDYRIRKGWSYSRIARAIRSTEGAARVHVANARRRLKQYAAELPPPQNE
jgi:RNA polymerase sigma factor (sigma-70 family)